MDDNLDEYQTIANSSEFRWTHPCLVRKKFDSISCKYKVEIQSLEPIFLRKARRVVEQDYCRYDIICANLRIADNPMATASLTNLMEARMNTESSVVAIEIETKKVIGLLVAMERNSFKTVTPDELEDQELEKDIQYIEELRCLLISRARNMMSRCMSEGDRYLEIVLLCGSRETANHYEIEVVLIDAFVKLAESRKIRFVMVISDYRKHQLHFLSLGFVKVSEMAYGTINSQFEEKKFPKTDASSSIMCLLLKMVDKARLRAKTQFEIKWSAPVRRVTRLKLAFH